MDSQGDSFGLRWVQRTRISQNQTVIMSDDGTENSSIEALQIFLRSRHNDENSGLGSFSIGTSIPQINE